MSILQLFAGFTPVLRCMFVIGSSLGLLACGGDSGTTPGNGSLPGALPPLPSPPLTSPPSQDDEPIVEAADLHTLSELTLVRDRGAPLPEEVVAELTLADFNAGTPEPVLQIPADVDPATNAAPFFDGIQNLEIDAGQILEILYRPLDPDGDVPGMFPVKLPEGATFDDNFNGSKTFRWQPLQRDVGIREFAVTAVDALNPSYRYTQNIRIKIELPSDLTTIPNVAPTLDRLPDFQYTVRTGDPVVAELKGIDLNGTVAIVELPNPPAGSSFSEHPRREGVYILKYVPSVAGSQNIEVLIRDSVDSSLTSTEFFVINVTDEDYPPRSGERLKTLAAARSIAVGYALSENFYHRPDGALYADIASAEFNLVTPEGSMKMRVINPLPGRYDFAGTDNLVTFANSQGMQIHGHPLVWHRVLPEWLLQAPKENLQGHMQEHIHRLMSRYKADINLWDVVNEPIGDNGGLRDSIWFQAMGEAYIDIALRQARATAPEATLLINEFDVAVPGPKADSFFELLSRLKSDEVPLDGVGLQLHVFASFDQFAEVRATFQRIADLDLDIYITELDVALTDGASNAQQADVFRELVSACIEQVRCRAIQTWGFTDQYSFRRQFNPLLFDRTYQEKPAYTAVQNALSGVGP